MNGIYFFYRNVTKICEVPDVPDVPGALYGSETWITGRKDESRMGSAEIKVFPSVERWKNRTGIQIKK